MGLVRADFRLVNLFTKQSVSIRALVDTGAMGAFVTWEVARQLGFDPAEVAVQYVTVADERRVAVPCLRPVAIHFEDRDCSSDVLVLGDECLMGVIPLESMELVVDPVRQRLIPDPKPHRQPVLDTRTRRGSE
jgi:clan AA aspartic protease